MEHLHEHRPPKPPHEREWKKGIVRALCISTIITGAFALALTALQLPLNVVIPSSAPIWAGLSAVLK